VCAKRLPYAFVSIRGRCFHGNRNRQVVQRCEGLWLHLARRRWRGSLRPLQRHRRQRLQVAEGGRQGGVRGDAGAQGPAGRERRGLGLSLVRAPAAPRRCGLTSCRWRVDLGTEDPMSSRSNKRQTLAKLARERAVKERRTRKQAKKDERKEAQLAGPADPSQSSSTIEAVPSASDSAA